MTEFTEHITGRSFNNSPDSPLLDAINLLHAGYILVSNGLYTRYEPLESNYDESYFHYFADGTSYSNAWDADSDVEFGLDANGNKYGAISRDGAPLASLRTFAPQMIIFDRNNSSYLFRNVALTNDGYDMFSSNDYFSTGNQNDIIFGAGGDDVIIAGGGNDFLSGGIGYNTLTGGSGADEFAFVDNITGARTRITDYNYNEGDTIGIKRIGETDFSNANTNLFIANNRKKYQKAMRSSHSFILDTKNKRLLYNADGAIKGLGLSSGGGTLIEFDNYVSNINMRFY